MNDSDDNHLPALVEAPERVDEEAADMALIEAGAELLTKLGSGAHLYQWIDEVGPAAEAMRRTAMRRAYMPRPEGSRYAREMGALVDSHPVYKDLKKEITNVLWLRDDPERLGLLTYLLGKMGARKRIRVNLPSSARALIERHMKQKTMLQGRAGTYGETETEADTPPPTPLQIVKDENRELKAMLADRDEHIAHIEGTAYDGGGIDLETARIEDIDGYIRRMPHKPSMQKKMLALKAFIETWLALPVKR